MTVLDPLVDPTPAGWEHWVRSSGRRASWAWPVLAAAASGCAGRLVVAVEHEGGEIRAVLLGQVAARLPVPGGRRLAAGYLHVRHPASSSDQGLWVAPGPIDQRRRGLRRLLAGVAAELGPTVPGLLWRQLDAGELALIPHLLVSRPSEPVAVLDLPAGGVDGWLARLVPRRRQSLRRTRRRLAETDVVVDRVPLTRLPDLPELAALNRANHAKHGGHRRDRDAGVRSVPWLAALAEHGGATATTYRTPAGRLTAAAVRLDHSRWPQTLSWAALEPAEGGYPHAYFDQLVREVQACQAQGASGFVWGKGMAALKEDLGARLVPQLAAVSLLRG